MEKILINNFEKVYSILEESFPRDEIRTYSEQRELFNNPRYCVYGDYDENLKGIMAVWEFESFLFLEHFAVAPEYRNKGLGADMLKKLISMSNKRICLEVEPPENEISIRRIEFYKRCGLFFNDFKYVQPPISKGRNPVPLFIMSGESSLDEDEFCKIKNILYKEVYKIDNIC